MLHPRLHGDLRVVRLGSEAHRIQDAVSGGATYMILRVAAAVILTFVFVLCLIEAAESGWLRQWQRALSTKWDRIVNWLDERPE